MHHMRLEKVQLFTHFLTNLKFAVLPNVPHTFFLKGTGDYNFR